MEISDLSSKQWAVLDLLSKRKEDFYYNIVNDIRNHDIYNELWEEADAIGWAVPALLGQLHTYGFVNYNLVQDPTYNVKRLIKKYSLTQETKCLLGVNV